MNTQNIELLPKQFEFLESPEEEVALVSGIGFGKTTVGSLFAITETAKYPSVPGIIVATTYSQLHSATLANLEQWCDILGIYYKYNSSTKYAQINNTKHFVRSAENYNTSRGIQGGWLWVDEASYISEEATDMFLGRIRIRGASLKKRYTTSANGFNFFYKRFHPSGENYLPERKLITAKTGDNFFLPESYEKSLRSSYSSKMAAQELDGEFVSMAGMNVYSDFDRKKHVKECNHLFKNKDSQQLYIFVDYNIDPFTGVVGFKEDGKIYFIDEIYLEGGADVRKMGGEILNRYSKVNPIVMGDGTGNSKRDILNIKLTAYKLFNEMGLTTIPFSNPHVAKRVGNFNRLLFHNKIVISPRCKRLINDLELVVYKKDGNDIDKISNKHLTHISDAASYLTWKLDPFIVNRGSRTIEF